LTLRNATKRSKPQKFSLSSNSNQASRKLKLLHHNQFKLLS
jgi:hypothetical protein